MKLVVVTYSTHNLNEYLKDNYIVKRVDTQNDKLFFLLKKSTNREQFIFTISTKDQNFKFSFRTPDDIRSLNEYLDKDWTVIDMYQQNDKFLYLIEKQTLKQKRKEKLERIEDVQE